ncbi:MAG: hypothetical protein ABH860_01465, partial [bacterium]
QSKLKEKGFSEKDIKILEKAVKRSLTTDPVFKPDSFMQRMASTENVFQLPDEPEQLSRMSKENIKEDVQRPQIEQGKKEAKERQLEGQQKNVDMKKLMTSSDVKEAVQQYSSAYAQKAQQSSPEANEQLKDAQSKLKEKGFSEKDIKILEKAVKRSLTTDPVFKPDSFMQRMASSENVFQPANEPEWIDRMFEGNIKDDSLEARDNIQNKDVQKPQIEQGKKEAKERQLEGQQKNVDMKKLMTSSDVKEAVQQYSSAYIQKALMANPEANENLKDAQSKLREKGFSEKDIKILEKAVKSLLKTDPVFKSNTFIEQIFSPTNTQQLADEPEQFGRIFEKDVREKSEKSEDGQKAQVRQGEKEHHLESREKKTGIKKHENSAELKEAMQQHSSAFAQFIVAASPEARERLEDARDRLRKKGFSEKDVVSIERSVKNSARAEYASKIQDSFVHHMFSPKNTFQFIVTSKNLNNTFEEAIKNEQLSGISNDQQDIKNAMGRVAQASHEEIKDFINEAVEGKLMERHISGKNNRNDVKKLVELGYKVGFNFESFLKTWEKKKFDLGLFVMEIENANRAENAGEISIGEVNAGGVNDKHGYEMTKDEERELLINQIRAEYLKKAITGDPFAIFTFAPKIRKLKNGLIKLGLETEDFNKIEKEAKVLARYRTLEMLKEAFLERSTYYELSGPAYNLLKNKIKGLVSNLKNLDMDLTREELDVLRDGTNRQMHDHTIIELKSAASILENHDNPAIKEKITLIKKLIQRLKEESGFSHGVGEDIDEIVFRHENDRKAVKEHA